MHCRAFWCGLLAKAARLPPPPPPLAFHISAEVSAAPLPPPHNEPEAGAALRREACGAGGSRIGRAARQRARVGLDLVVDINVEHVVFVVASGDVSKAEVAVKSHGFGIVGGPSMAMRHPIPSDRRIASSIDHSKSRVATPCR